MAVRTQSETVAASRRHVGRPKVEESDVVHIRVPLAVLARLDRYLDHLETTTGLKANRGMIARRAVVEFLDTHEKK